MAQSNGDELKEQTRRSIARLISIQRGDDNWSDDDYITAGNILFVCRSYIKKMSKADRKQHELDARIDTLETILMLNPHAGSMQVDSYDESDSGDAYVFITLAEKLTELKAEREELK